LNKNVWKSFTGEHINKKRNILRKNLNKDQIIEYDLLRNLSEKLIMDNYERNPTFRRITKTGAGYSISRTCYQNKADCNWNINININNNETILSCSKKCDHKKNVSIYFGKVGFCNINYFNRHSLLL
jgi:hypothetical protein